MNRCLRHAMTIVAAAAMGLGIAGCSGDHADHNTASSSGSIDACKLVSAEQASKILGTRITMRAMDTSAAGPGAASMCNYTGQRADSGFMLIAARIAYGDAAAEVARQKKQEISDVPPGLPKPSFSDVHGLGDAAYLYKVPGSFQLHVLAHGAAIVISRNTDAGTQTVDQAKRIAKAALTKLN